MSHSSDPLADLNKLAEGRQAAALCFTVPGEPRGKGRPRFGNGRTYTDAKTASYEALVGWYAREAMGASLRPFDGPVCVTMAARFAPAASASRKARAAMLAGETAPTGRFDIDNIIKAACDGLNGIAFADDRQVVSVYARKLYAETPGLDVVIRPYSAPAAEDALYASRQHERAA